ncbi:serine/threonine-protein kinase [Nostoc sp. CMAA1605]|uniref:serine/threonine-protein kinase n=1 Tax=Nostoc sp. CMAA1605 TaxID=2055159 RepID=UPI001F1B5B67|nr:serine/threonine-protein kinase [Nostoc sp. CMAA1605]MCF4965671.1 serine/threonine protein kinase [Nostoc sp. CMAA1605]
MTCCLNPACHNPPHPDGVNFCSNCGVPLIVLRNRYRPIKTLGGGGFGKTYLAEDVDKLNEHCVIKQFAPQVQGTGALNKATELFEQEAKRLQQLGKHPQIPTLLAYFNEDNRLYLVQEFIDGQNLLKELRNQGNFAEKQVRELLQDLLDILKTVHQQKVIHRDIKPENIIRDSNGKLVLIDFGASKQLTATVMTSQGTTIGSFGYAPLEQMQGGEAYPASDLYSVGATCFHLLSGIHPWELWKRQGYGWVGSWRQHLPQTISEEFGQILDKLLQEEHQQRYQSAQEVLEALNPPPPPPVTPIQTLITTPPLASPPALPTQPVITTSASPFPVTVPSQPPILTPPVKPKAPPQKPFASNTKLKKRLLAGVAITLGGLVLTQFIGYVRHTLFPSNPISLTASEDSDVFLTRTLRGHSGKVSSVGISQDGKTLVSGSYDKTIKLWNLATGEEIRTLTGHSKSVNSVAISPDGNTLASGGGEGNAIKLWNMATGEENRPLTGGYFNSVNSIAISPDGKTLASANDGDTIELWNLATGKQIRTLKGHPENLLSIASFNSVAISPDGKTLASGSDDNTIKLWNLATGELILTLRELFGFVRSVAISPDGKILASGSSDNTIKLWNLSTGELIRTLRGHSSSVYSVAISPDGKTLASGSADSTIKLWNLATGEEIRTLKGHSYSVYSVAISPDSKTLVSGSEDNTIKIWRLE